MMSPEQLRFKQYLERNAPEISKLFDWNKREVVFSRVENYLNYASSGEALLARFFVGIWLNKNAYNFDIFTAVRSLDTHNLKKIYRWLSDPLWP